MIGRWDSFCKNATVVISPRPPGKAPLSPIQKLALNPTAKKTATPAFVIVDKAFFVLHPSGSPLYNRECRVTFDRQGLCRPEVDVDMDTLTPSQEVDRVGDEPEAELSSADR
jgi:hypothetical protein